MLQAVLIDSPAERPSSSASEVRTPFDAVTAALVGKRKVPQRDCTRAVLHQDLDRGENPHPPSSPAAVESGMIMRRCIEAPSSATTHSKAPAINQDHRRSVVSRSSAMQRQSTDPQAR